MARLRALVVAAVVAASGTVVGVAPGIIAPVPVAAAPNPTPTIDPTNRASVWNAYQNSLVPARATAIGWTGSTATCTKGTESAASIEATRAAFNFYRAMVGLPGVTMNATKNDEAMAAALIMQAKGQIDHDPPSDWPCWTAQGDAAAGSSNLSQGIAGASAIDAYMADLGPGNSFAGHRRTMFYPYTTNIGTGSTTSYNALRVYGGEGPRPTGPTWIAWPNAGFVPKRALRPFTFAEGTILFSLSSNVYPDADYTAAQVTVKVGSTSLAVDVNGVVDGYGDNTLTWDVTPPANYDSSDADVRFDITVSGMKQANGTPIPTRTYSSTAITSAGTTTTAPGAPTGVSATAGNGQATVSWTAPSSNGGSAITGYKVTPYKGATAQTPQSFTGTGTSRIVTGLTNGVAYTFKVQAVNAVGAGALSAASNAVTPAGPPYAPYSSWTQLIDQIHLQLLGRTATQAERDQWLVPLQTGNQSPGDLVAALRQSNHHKAIVDQVTRLYRAYYLRIPDKGGLEYWIAQRLSGKSMTAISDFFAKSPEFKTLYGSKTTAEFVTLVYDNVLGRQGSADEKQYWIGEITSGRRSRGAVMLGFSESPEHRAAQASETTVSVLYVLWLDRAPTKPEFDAGVAALDGGQTVADYADTLLAKVPAP